MRPATALVLAILALPGCDVGGESDENEPGSASTPAAEPGAALTKAQYEERYLAATEGSDEAVRELESVTVEDPDRLAAAFADSAEVVRSQAKALGALRPPADIADEHEDYVALVRDTASAYDRVARALADAPNNAAALEELGALEQLLLSEENKRRARAFARAVELGDYDLGIDAGESTAPGQPLLP